MNQEQAEREVYAALHGMGWFSRANHDNLTDAGREIVARLLGDKRSVLIERMGESRVGIRRKLNSILCHLDDIERKVDKLMALADDLKAGIAQLNTETTAIGNLITKLAGEIKNGMTDAEVADVKASLTTLSDRLTSLAVDPTVPVPPAPPQLQALKAKK